MSCWEIDANKAKSQLSLCTMLMNKLDKRLRERCKKQGEKGMIRGTSYDMPQPLTNEALERQITMLRMELFELQKIIRE